MTFLGQVLEKNAASIYEDVDAQSVKGVGCGLYLVRPIGGKLNPVAMPVFQKFTSDPAGNCMGLLVAVTGMSHTQDLLPHD